MRSPALVRLSQLDKRRRRLLFRAAFSLTVASFAVAALPFRLAMRYGPVPVRRRASVAVDDCIWAIEAAGRRLPWRTMCIEKGLATQRLLRQAGVEAILHYGARHDRDSGKLEAHVWVSVDGATVIGDESPMQFAEIATYG